MPRLMDHRIAAVALGLILSFSGPFHAAAAPAPDRQPIPQPLGYVTDQAGMLDPDWKARIRSVCQDLERKTGVEMVVVTVKNLAPYRSANEYAATIYQRWGVGSAQKEYGVVILAAIEERRAAVTVGKPLVGRITASMMEDVGRQYVDPAFRQGEYGEGLYRATVALASGLHDIRVGESTVLTGIGAFAFLWWISRPDLRHPFGRLRRGEFWGSGQGGFGGNFGGFGGGTSGEELK
jgi:uncharacterized protein